MTAESLKSFISLPSHSSQCSNNRYAKGNKIGITIFAVFMVLLCCGILGLEIWNTIRTTQLAQETEQLKNALDEMKHRIGFDTMDDLEDFENSYDHTAPIPDGDIAPSEDEMLGLFDEIDDDEFTYDDDDELEGSSDFEKDDDYEISESMYGDSTPKRHVRSATSPHGVPIVEESYALRRNRTNPRVDDEISRLLLNKGRPTLRHADWNDGRAPSSAHNLPVYHHNSFPKKYQQHRAPPTEYVQSPYRQHVGRTSNENNLHQYANQHRNAQDVTASSYNVRSGRAMPTNGVKTKAFRRSVKQNEFAKLRNERTLDSVETINSGPVHRSGRGRSAHQNRVKSIAIHFSGDTSKYANLNNENYKGEEIVHYDGNGRLLHNGGTYTDWEASPWVNILAMDRFFKLDRGVVTIHENGLYYVYAQIFYHDEHDLNGFVVQHNAETFLQCTVMTHSEQRVIKSNTCYTSGVAYLYNGDTIRLNDLGNHRHALFEPSKSFFGLIKMGDPRPLHETLA